jgi:hypothetical protein
MVMFYKLETVIKYGYKTKLLTDGTTVNPDGTSRKRGDRLRLRNGECLDMNGVKYSNEYQYRSK